MCGRWYSFDDEKISATSARRALTDSASLLWYQLKVENEGDFPFDFCTIPLVKEQVFSITSYNDAPEEAVPPHHPSSPESIPHPAMPASPQLEPVPPPPLTEQIKSEIQDEYSLYTDSELESLLIMHNLPLPEPSTLSLDSQWLRNESNSTEDIVKVIYRKLY